MCRGPHFQAVEFDLQWGVPGASRPSDSGPCASRPQMVHRNRIILHVGKLAMIRVPAILYISSTVDVATIPALALQKISLCPVCCRCELERTVRLKADAEYAIGNLGGNSRGVSFEVDNFERLPGLGHHRGRTSYGFSLPNFTKESYFFAQIELQLLEFVNRKIVLRNEILRHVNALRLVNVLRLGQRD